MFITLPFTFPSLLDSAASGLWSGIDNPYYCSTQPNVLGVSETCRQLNPLVFASVTEYIGTLFLRGPSERYYLMVLEI